MNEFMESLVKIGLGVVYGQELNKQIPYEDYVEHRRFASKIMLTEMTDADSFYVATHKKMTDAKLPIGTSRFVDVVYDIKNNAIIDVEIQPLALKATPFFVSPNAEEKFRRLNAIRRCFVGTQDKRIICQPRSADGARPSRFYFPDFICSMAIFLKECDDFFIDAVQVPIVDYYQPSLEGFLNGRALQPLGIVTRYAANGLKYVHSKMMYNFEVTEDGIIGHGFDDKKILSEVAKKNTANVNINAILPMLDKIIFGLAGTAMYDREDVHYLSEFKSAFADLCEEISFEHKDGFVETGFLDDKKNN
jgi:hypothetical protein